MVQRTMTLGSCSDGRSFSAETHNVARIQLCISKERFVRFVLRSPILLSLLLIWLGMLAQKHMHSP